MHSESTLFNDKYIVGYKKLITLLNFHFTYITQNYMMIFKTYNNLFQNIFDYLALAINSLQK